MGDTVLIDETEQNGNLIEEVYFLKSGKKLFDRYKIIEVVGFGGFGILYKANDLFLDKVIAIKEYFPTSLVHRIKNSSFVEAYSSMAEITFLQGKERFLKEAQSMSKFSQHDNIVNIYNYFETNNTAYIIMEYLAGISLKKYLQQKSKLMIDEAESIAIAIIGALEIMHGEKIIHRDVSPDNIFICDNGKIKLIDFGASHFADDTTDAEYTIIIKPGYAPPEQYQSKGKQGAWTDIYALGATLYQVVTGIKPEESINRQVNDSVVSIKTINPLIPDFFCNIIEKCMALNYEVRYKNVNEIKKSITEKRKVKKIDDEISFKKKKRTFVFVYSGVLLLILIATFAYIFFEKSSEANLRPAEITIWVMQNEAGTLDSSFEGMLDNFKEDYPFININVTYINEDDYEKKLDEAFMNNTLPVLFETTNYSLNGKEDKLFSLDRIYSNMILENYYNINNEIQNNEYALPLSLTLPVKYVNLSNSNDEGNQLVDFVNGDISVYYGNTNDYYQINNELKGKYSIESNTNMQAYLYSKFSINKNTYKKQKNAAIRILQYFLEVQEQEIWCIDCEKGVPINVNAVDTYEDVNMEFEPIIAELEIG